MVVTVLWAAQVIKDGYKDNGWMSVVARVWHPHKPEIMGNSEFPINQTYPDQKYRTCFKKAFLLKDQK